ncbi:MAG: hypothetical protein V4654_15595 [Bdellovibrionota bacterium]
MNENKHHILADIVLYSSENGGRKGPTPTKSFGCPLQILDKLFDCRFILENLGSLFPGDEKHRIPVIFLSPGEALNFFGLGSKFKIWELGIIGEGRVVEVNSIGKNFLRSNRNDF